jgi:hypothetical protein
MSGGGLGGSGHTPADALARWTALRDSAHELVDAVSEPDLDGFRAALNQTSQIAGGLDVQAFLNTPHIPEDAGEYAEALARILARIPDGWGRWISCDAGWYSLIVELDEELSCLLPGYEVHQVKEKYGTLCYYWGAPTAPTDPNDPEPQRLASGADDISKQAWRDSHMAWSERQDAYEQTPEGATRHADHRRRVDIADKLVEAIEDRSQYTCETCGAPGEAHCTLAPSPWYKTLCESCASTGSYAPAHTWPAWWEQAKPDVEARHRARFVDEHVDARVLVVTADSGVRVSLPQAEYIHDVAAATSAATGEWDLVFFDDDVVAAAFCCGLRARYRDHEEELSRKRAETADKRRHYDRAPGGCPQLFHLRGGAVSSGVGHEARRAIGVACRAVRPEHQHGPLLRD